MKYVRILAGLALAAASPALAEVKAVESGGFVVAFSATVSAPPPVVWAALMVPGRWWDMTHSYSQDGANLTLDPLAGGCFCEKVPQAKGAVEHMRVVQIMPNRLLRLQGALGPFQSMGVSGAMTWELKPSGSGTAISLSYAIGGYMPGGGQGYAPIVDQVIGGQFARLTAFVDKK